MNKINNDRGISLIEIVIALAIMSLLMTAVVSLMSSNTIVFRKTKSDIEVQNQAESTFNTIADSVHSAKAIYAEGYILEGDNEIKFNSDDLPIDATTFQVKDDAVKTFAKGTDALTTSSSFESLDGTKIKKVYLTKLVVLYAAPIDFQKDLGATVTTLADGTKVFNWNNQQIKLDELRLYDNEIRKANEADYYYRAITNNGVDNARIREAYRDGRITQTVYGGANGLKAAFGAEERDIGRLSNILNDQYQRLSDRRQQINDERQSTAAQRAESNSKRFKNNQ